MGQIDYRLLELNRKMLVKLLDRYGNTIPETEKVMLYRDVAKELVELGFELRGLEIVSETTGRPVEWISIEETTQE